MPALDTTPASARYDRMTILLHWLTAFLVIFLFASAHTWQLLEHGPLRKTLQSLHISAGILLALAMVTRILWRKFAGTHLPAVSRSGAMNLLALLMHRLLYLLLVAQVCLGFMFRWAQGEDFYFFGLFSIPDIFSIEPLWRHNLAELHNYVAWALVILAGVHAVAALFHHYLLRDGTLLRMLPTRDSTAVNHNTSQP